MNGNATALERRSGVQESHDSETSRSAITEPESRQSVRKSASGNVRLIAARTFSDPPCADIHSWMITPATSLSHLLEQERQSSAAKSPLYREGRAGESHSSTPCSTLSSTSAVEQDLTECPQDDFDI